MSRRSYVAEAEIDAPVEEVWAALVDFERYRDWNPFTTEARTSFEVGRPIDMRVRLSSYGITISQRETVRAVEPNERIVWGTVMMLGFVRAERTQTLTALDGGRTRYRTEDVIEGALGGLVHVLMGRSIQTGFDGVAAGLRERFATADR